MGNTRTTNPRLVRELSELRQRPATLEAAETAHQLQTAALAASQREYEVLVNSIEGIVWELDLATERFACVSRQAGPLVGYPVERWLSEPDFWRETCPSRRSGVGGPNGCFAHIVAHD